MITYILRVFAGDGYTAFEVKRAPGAAAGGDDEGPGEGKGDPESSGWDPVPEEIQLDTKP